MLHLLDTLPIFLLTAVQEGASTATAHATESVGHSGVASMGVWEQIVSSNAFNVILVVLFLGWVIKKFGLLEQFEKSRLSVQQEIETLASEKKEAEEELAAMKQQTETLSKEVDTILQEAEISAKALSQQILENAQAEATKMIQATEKRLVLEQQIAAKVVQARLLEASIQLAGENLAQSLGTTEQRRSVDDFVTSLAGSKS